MTFNSLAFLIFYPVVALLYFLLPHRLRYLWLLLASYFFYAFYRADLLVLIIGTTAVSWASAMLIERTEKKWLKRLYLTVTLIICLGVLFFYKYFNFLADSVVSIIRLLGGSAPRIILDAALPMGISFYTFQTLSYVIDVYRGDIKTERNPLFYALFVSFFPQLVAGPIERPGALIPQLKEHHVPEMDNFVKGGKHMLLGFFKKICVADVLAVYVNAVYNDPVGASGLGVLLATVMFAVQIYCDFSGYTDIAIGCARIMGIRLMKNFDHPYSATTVKDFWARWHISLSGWFRDYLYFPLGGSRCPRYRHLLNLFIVFAVSGLWHGANWTFVIWGALHGFYRVVGALTEEPRRRLLSKLGASQNHTAVIWCRRVLTFFLVVFAWTFFRANSLSDAGILLGKLFGDWSGGLGNMGLELSGAVLCVLAWLCLLLLDRMLTYGDGQDGSELMVRRGAYAYLVWIIILAWVMLLSEDIVSSFIYFEF